jgi:enoyl-CoA hydratase
MPTAMPKHDAVLSAAPPPLSLNPGVDTRHDVGLALEAASFGLCASTEDKAEGTKACLEKRTPPFRGR